MGRSLSGSGLLISLLVSCLADDPANVENLKLTQYRQQHRRTQDGKLCAAAFVEGRQRFTDCTSTLAPDGQTVGKEWCYVESQYNLDEEGQQVGSKPVWGFCRAVIDYNYVRAAASESLRTRLDEVATLSAKLAADKNKLDDVRARYDRVCVRQLPQIQTRVAKMKELIEHGKHALQGAEEAAASIQALDNSLDEIAAAAEEDAIRALSQPENCRAVMGYQDDGEADGLLGVYFPTGTFSCAASGVTAGGTPCYGRKQIRLDPTINFAWSHRSPAPGIPVELFSVRWSGFLAPPITDEYKLHLTASCGARVWINKRLVINDRLAAGEYIENEENEIPMPGISGSPPGRKVSSPPLMLTGGEKIPIRIEFLHASHLLYANEDTAFITLAWSSMHMPEEPIAPDYFFSSRVRPTLKISRMPANLVDITYLTPGVQPWLGDSKHVVGDLPFDLENSRLIRMSAATQKKLFEATSTSDPNQSTRGGLATSSPQFFEFAVNIPAKLFVAYSSASNPLESCGPKSVTFNSYSGQLGIYSSTGAAKRRSNVLRLKTEVAVLASAGGYRFKVNDGTQFVAFLRALPASAESCDGEVMVLSDLGDFHSPAQDCKASSQADNTRECRHGVNRLKRDEAYGSWKTSAGRGVGEWIELTFRESVRVASLFFKPLDDPLLWPSELTVYTGATVPGSLKDDGQKLNLVYSADTPLLKYPLAPAVTQKIRVEVSGMFAADQSTGGSLEISGSVCASHVAPAALNREIKAFAVDSCEATLSDFPDLPSLRSDLTLDVDCPSTCEPPKTPRVFGSSVYSADSAVCLAAVHAGVCGLNENVCEISLLVIHGAERYLGCDRYGVMSGTHGPSDFSFVVQPRHSSNALGGGAGDSAKGERAIIVFNSDSSASAKTDDGTMAFDDGRITHTSAEGLVFGWDRQATTAQCSTPVNPAVKGGVSFPAPPASDLCKAANGQDCEPNAFTIELQPNKLYNVVAQLGHPCEPEGGERTYRYDLQVNGIPAVANKQLAAGETWFATTNGVSTGASGKVRITSACDQGDCASALTTILRLKVVETTA